MFIDILNELMSKKGINKNILSKESGIPYTTIDGFYKKGSENIKLSTLQKLSEYFNVSLDYLVKGDECTFTEHEKRLITEYRNKPDMQSAVDTLLNVKRKSGIEMDFDFGMREALKVAEKMRRHINSK